MEVKTVESTPFFFPLPFSIQCCGQTGDLVQKISIGVGVM